jgi:translation initiation factor IF-3
MVKVKKTKEFLQNNDKVKVSIRFRGRELGYTTAAIDIFKDFAAQVSEFSQIEQEPKMDARVMSMLLTPTTQKKQEKKEKEQNA